MIAKLTKYQPNSYLSQCSSCANLISFGNDIYLEWLGSGNMFYKIEAPYGRGFVAYKIDTDVTVSAVYVDAPNIQSQRIIYEDLLMSVRNDASALQKNLIVNLSDESLQNFINFQNQLFKEQGIEEIYRWTLTQ